MFLLERFLRPSQARIPGWLAASFFIFTIAFLLISIWNVALTTSMGENDFVAYWSATYLFRNGQDPYDPSLMELTQDTKLKTSQNVTIMAWNPPTLFVFLLPLAWLSFLQAKFLWLIINLIIVISMSLTLVHIYDAPQNMRFIVIHLLFALIFPPVVSGLYMGQVTFLVLLGLVSSMWLIKKEMWFGAGMILILTTIKPHLVILPLIYLLVHVAQQRQYKGWLGLIVSGFVCIFMIFLFRPDWVNDLIGLSAIAPVNWATPTLGGLLSSLGITEYARYLIVLFLPLPIWMAANRTMFSMEFSVAVLTLITIPVTFFGWNYDQSMLLIPISLAFAWVAKSKDNLPKLLIIFAIAASLGANIYLRLLSSNDMFFLWVPLFWWLIFPLAGYLYMSQIKTYE